MQTSLGQPLSLASSCHVRTPPTSVASQPKLHPNRPQRFPTVHRIKQMSQSANSPPRMRHPTTSAPDGQHRTARPPHPFSPSASPTPDPRRGTAMAHRLPSQTVGASARITNCLEGRRFPRAHINRPPAILGTLRSHPALLRGMISPLFGFCRCCTADGTPGSHLWNLSIQRIFTSHTQRPLPPRFASTPCALLSTHPPGAASCSAKCPPFSPLPEAALAIGSAHRLA